VEMTEERLKEIEQNAPRITMHDAERGVEIIYELTAAFRTLEQQNERLVDALENMISLFGDNGTWGSVFAEGRAYVMEDDQYKTLVESKHALRSNQGGSDNG
jgi:hypothetical protein